MDEWVPLFTHQHNDLNPANVLVDVRGSAWLIDFARCKVMNPFTDTAQMVARLLWQVHIIPLTIDDLRGALAQWRAGQSHPARLLRQSGFIITESVDGLGLGSAWELPANVQVVHDPTLVATAM